MEVVVECFALTQKFGAKYEILGSKGLTGFGCVTHRNGGLDHHNRLGIDGHDIIDHSLDTARIEIIGNRVVVCGGGNNDKVCPLVCL
jgi:hypothetical protein